MGTYCGVCGETNCDRGFYRKQCECDGEEEYVCTSCVQVGEIPICTECGEDFIQDR